MYRGGCMYRVSGSHYVSRLIRGFEDRTMNRVGLGGFLILPCIIR